jgi:hypothetical protein
MFIKRWYFVTKGGGAIIPTSPWCCDKQQILSEVLWKLLQKEERKQRMTLMPDEDFEGDFLEVQENSQGIVNAASGVFYWFDLKSGMKMTFENG